MKTIIDFSSLNGDKSCWELLKQLHDALLATRKGVVCRVFPIYIRYDDDEKTIALLYFRGVTKKKLEDGEIELGLNIGNAKLPKGFNNGKEMKYAGINCSIKIDATNISAQLKKQLFDAIKLTKY
jgi:hypothetical protein